jgi:hypothetical protein
LRVRKSRLRTLGKTHDNRIGNWVVMVLKFYNLRSLTEKCIRIKLILMFLLMRGTPRKAEGEASFEPCSVTMATSSAPFSTPNLSRFPMTYFPYESLPLREVGGHGFNQVETDAKGIRSDRTVLLGVVRIHQPTAKTKGECHWDACMTHGTSRREQATHRAHLASGMQPK